MLEKWKRALSLFLEEYEDNDDVIGALLCGSYASGNETNNSDIDVHLILKDSVDYRQRGVKEVNGFLIEYFMNPIRILKKEIEEENIDGGNCTTTMFAYGKIIYDLEGKVKELQDFATDYFDKPLKDKSINQIKMNNYHIWDLLDELKTALDEKSNNFELIYYNLLSKIYNCYAEYLNIPKLAISKTYKILSNEEFRKKYHVYKLPEKEFIKLYLDCFEKMIKEDMFNNISKLVEYYFNKQGGFDITKFYITSKEK